MLPVVFVPGMLCGAVLWSSVQARLDAPVIDAEVTASSIGGGGRAGARERGRSLRARGPQPGCDRRVRGIVRDPQRVAGFCAISTNAGAPSVGQDKVWRAMANRTARGEFTDLVRDTILPTMFASAEPRHTVPSGSLPWRTASGPEPSALSSPHRPAAWTPFPRCERCAVQRSSSRGRPMPCARRASTTPLPNRSRVRASSNLPGVGHLCTWERPRRCGRRAPRLASRHHPQPTPPPWS